MKWIKKLAIILFDFLDQNLHQKRIYYFFKERRIDLDFCIDVGTHLGLYTDLILKINNKAKILLFEPQNFYFEKLKKKYKKNKNIKVFGFALSDKKAKKTLYVNKHDLTSSLKLNINKNLYFKLKAFLFDTSVSGMIKKKEKIKTNTLSNILPKKKIIIDFIKIDTEGYEFEVIKGISKKIFSTRYLLVEFHSQKTYKNYSPKKIHDYLVKNGFELIKTFHFPLSTFEDRIYENINIQKI